MKNTDTVGSCQTDLIIGCIWKKMNKSSGSLLQTVLETCNGGSENRIECLSKL